LQQIELREKEQHIAGQSTRMPNMGIDIRNERIPSTLKISNKSESAMMIGKKPKLPRINELSVNQKCISSTLSHSERENPRINRDGLSKSTKRFKNIPAERLNNSELKSEFPPSIKRPNKNVQLTNLKVKALFYISRIIYT
jgi:hypothetical protein